MTAAPPRLRHQPLLLAEALVALVIASLALRLIPFRDLAKRGNGAPGGQADAQTAQSIRRALTAWGDRVPWRALCFERGLAARSMLRRRGLAVTLCYGARHSTDGRLEAHVWVQSRGQDVIGCEIMNEFRLLATF